MAESEPLYSNAKNTDLRKLRFFEVLYRESELRRQSIATVRKKLDARYSVDCKRTLEECSR